MRKHQGLIAVGAIVLLLAAIIWFSAAGTSHSDDLYAVGDGSGTPPSDVVVDASAAMAECDRLAAMPGDPQRVAAPVDDAMFAPGAALTACQSAADTNPDMPRAKFQLARSMWLSGQKAEAFEWLKAARLEGYGAASLLLGHAYRDGHLPPDQEANLITAATLYEEALKQSVDGAQAAYDDAKREIDRNTFDKALFQNGDYMEKLYNGEFKGTKYPLSLLYYMQGIAHGMEDSNVIFMDQSCKVLLSSLGSDVLNNAEGVVAIASALDSMDENGNWTPDGLFSAFQSNLAKKTVIDQGMRDATILYSEDGRYGCKSEVTQKILGNMMLVIRNTH